MLLLLSTTKDPGFCFDFQPRVWFFPVGVVRRCAHSVCAAAAVVVIGSIPCGQSVSYHCASVSIRPSTGLFVVSLFVRCVSSIHLFTSSVLSPAHFYSSVFVSLLFSFCFICLFRLSLKPAVHHVPKRKKNQNLTTRFQRRIPPKAYLIGAHHITSGPQWSRPN